MRMSSLHEIIGTFAPKYLVIITILGCYLYKVLCFRLFSKRLLFLDRFLER